MANRKVEPLLYKPRVRPVLSRNRVETVHAKDRRNEFKTDVEQRNPPDHVRPSYPTFSNLGHLQCWEVAEADWKQVSAAYFDPTCHDLSGIKIIIIAAFRNSLSFD